MGNLGLYLCCMRRHRLWNLFCFLLPLGIQAQDTPEPAYELGVALHPGFLMAHQQSMLPMQAHTLGVELQFTKRVFPNPSWSDAYNHPGVGLNALYMNLGNPDINGHVFALLPTFETGLGTHRKAQWTFRAATGIGWVTRRFDVYSNRSNQAMSSHLNGAMQLALTYHKQVKNSHFKAGVIVTHFSNASARVPNLGINMPALYMGYSGLFSERGRHQMSPEKDLARLPWLLYGAWATKQLNPGNPQHFNIFTLGARRLIPAEKEHRFFRVGTDLFLDKTHVYVKDINRPLNTVRLDEMSELGFTLGYQLGISRVDFYADLGLYAYRPSNFKPPLYQRLGFALHFTDQWMAHMALKTHYATADIFEWGIGYKLKQSKK